MITICLQSGHEGRTSGSTGAPGEVELNVRIRNRLSQILIEKGFVLQLVNADPTPSEIGKDYNLFLALHGDADIYGKGGGFVDFPDPVTDKATKESQRIAKCIREEYFKHAEIVEYPSRSNANTKYYYMWDRLSAKTPCVIIEMGVVQDAHDKVLLADTNRIAGAIARGICKAFNVPYDVVIPEQPTTPPVTPSEPIQHVCVPSQEDLLNREKVIKLEATIKSIHDIMYGSGWWFIKYWNIQKLVPKD